jgi:hypothetical protein
MISLLIEPTTPVSRPSGNVGALLAWDRLQRRIDFAECILYQFGKLLASSLQPQNITKATVGRLVWLRTGRRLVRMVSVLEVYEAKRRPLGNIPGGTSWMRAAVHSPLGTVRVPSELDAMSWVSAAM